MDFQEALKEMRLPTPEEVVGDFSGTEVRELENKIRDALQGFRSGENHVYVHGLSSGSQRLAVAKLRHAGWRADLDPEFGRIVIKKP